MAWPMSDVMSIFMVQGQLVFELIKPFVRERFVPNSTAIKRQWGTRSEAHGTRACGANSLMFCTYENPPDQLVKRLAAILNKPMKLEYLNLSQDFVGRMLVNPATRKWKDDRCSPARGNLREDMLIANIYLQEVYRDNNTTVSQYTPD